jgi:glycosyltransferase involved in cell wall biosynthesis
MSLSILRVIRSLDPGLGGTVEAVRQAVLAAQAHGAEVEIATMDDPHAAFLADAPCPVHALPGRGTYGWSPGLEPWLQANLARFDIATIEGLWQFHGPTVRRAARAARRPYVVWPHGMLDPWFKRASRLKHLKKTLYFHLRERAVLCDAACVVFTADDEERLAHASFGRLPIRSAVVPLGVVRPPAEDGGQRRAFDAACPGIDRAPYILFLGRLNPKKGPDLLLDAFQAVSVRRPDLHLVMAGPGDPAYIQRLRSRADSACASRIHWPGMLQGEAKWGAFRGAKLFALPSHQENFGIAIVEALACGVPVLISTAVNIWREIIADGAGIACTDHADNVERNLLSWAGGACHLTPEAAQASYLRHYESATAGAAQMGLLTRLTQAGLA